VSVSYGGSVTERQRDEHRVEVLVIERCEVLGGPDLDETCPVSTEGGTKRVQLVGGEGRGAQGMCGTRVCF
jgi:hypothetical protein